MSVNWDSIKYIFQIPLKWYKSISDRVFNAYGSNFIVVKEGYYGGTEFGVDEDAFASEVAKHAGSVKSVDGVTPDQSGNIQLDAVTLHDDQTIDGAKTFEDDITLQDAKIEFDALSAESTPVKTGEITSTPTVDGGTQVTITAQNGNNSAGIASTVDAQGNEAQLLVGGPDNLYSSGDNAQLASRGYCRLNFARTSHDHGHISNDGKITTTAGTTPIPYFIAADSTGNLYREAITTITTGYVTDDSLQTILSDYVLANDLSDVLDDYAEKSWVQQQGYLTDADLSNYVTTTLLNTTLQNYVTNNDLTTVLQDYITSADLASTLDDYATKQDIADFVTESQMDTYVAAELATFVCAKSVDGHSPDEFGAVSFGLASSKWLKSDANGHIATTNEEPIIKDTTARGYMYNNAGTIQYDTLTASKWVKTDANGRLTVSQTDPLELDATQQGYLYNTNGTLSYKDQQYVTLDTIQIITGAKTFSGQGHMITCVNGDVTAIGAQGLAATFGNSGFSQSYTTTTDSWVMTLGAAQNSGGGYHPELLIAAGHGYGSIKRNDNTQGLKLEDMSNITLDAPANGTKLENQPTDSTTSSLAVATVGYCQTNFGKVKTVNGNSPDANGNVNVGGGVVTTVDHKSPDSTGNIQLNAISTINGHNGDSTGNFSGVVQSVDGNTPDANGAVTLSGFVKSVESNTPDANGDVTLSGMVKSVDGHSPDANGAVSFGLAGSKFCRTTADGHISTTSANVIYLPSGTTALTQGQFSVVTGVTWNGTQLVVTHRNFVFENGVLKTANTQANTTIETVAYTPS